MVKKFVLAVLLLSLLLVIAFDVRSSVPVAASPLIIRVPDDYQTIQEAVNAANLGDIVLVSAGTYYEHVRVNKTISLVGESRGTTIIDGNRTGVVLYVTANNVKISGFTIQNGGGWEPLPGYGIVLDRCNGNTIHGNTIASSVSGGIWLNGSSGNMIINNQVLKNGGGPLGLMYGEGITLVHSHGNIVSNNSISNNVVLGIVLTSSHDNVVNHNTFRNNSDGVGIGSSAGNIVSDNVMTSNGNGISVEGSTGNTIKHNQIFKNEIGIGIGESEMNVIRENNITENTIHGIAIADISPNNTFVGNTVSKNLNGIKIHYSNGSVIYHNNFIDNTKNAPEDVYPNVNTWDDGYPSGGNYWSDYNGTDLFNGPYQNEAGSDGIGDTPHTLDARNEDRFPLMGPISFFDGIYISSNSTISNFQLNRTQRIVSFNVTGPDYTVGFCRVTIPNIIIQDLWQNNYTVLVDGNLPLTTNNWTEGTCTYTYFTYLHSEHEVVITPEFPVATILPLFAIISLCATVLKKKTKL
jgi:parallel beta-helix repeat protein